MYEEEKTTYPKRAKKKPFGIIWIKLINKDSSVLERKLSTNIEFFATKKARQDALDRAIKGGGFNGWFHENSAYEFFDRRDLKKIKKKYKS